MPENYFRDLVEKTPTRVWVNNPTERRDGSCARAGRRSARRRTRPTAATCCGGPPARSCPSSQECVHCRMTTWWSPTSSSSALSAASRSAFRPLFETSGGTAGFVSIQGSPETGHGRTITSGRRPTTATRSTRTRRPRSRPPQPGLAHLRAWSPRAGQIIVTEVFSLDQVVDRLRTVPACDRPTGVRPPVLHEPDHRHPRRPPQEACQGPEASTSRSGRWSWPGWALARRCAPSWPSGTTR